MKNTFNIGFLFTLTAAVRAEELRDSQNKTVPKPFGLGIGPVYIGGRDTDAEGTELSLEIYSQYVNYKRMMGQNMRQDEEYYQEWFEKDECIGSCPGSSYCSKGVCICNHAESVTQVYGRCFSNSTAYFVGNKDKYRKPTPPPRPKWCFCEYRDEQGRTSEKVCPENQGRIECQVPTYPDEFDHKNQFCLPNDNNFCLGKDINMYCSDKLVLDPRDSINKNVCMCKKDMEFDTKNMECRIFLDVDCTYETADGYEEDGELARILRGQSEPGLEFNYAPDNIRKTFCNLIDGESTEYVEHLIGEFTFTILGLSIGAFLALCCISTIICCCCCNCCASTRDKIRRMDPRNAMRGGGMGAEYQMGENNQFL